MPFDGDRGSHFMPSNDDKDVWVFVCACARSLVHSFARLLNRTSIRSFVRLVLLSLLFLRARNRLSSINRWCDDDDVVIRMWFGFTTCTLWNSPQIPLSHHPKIKAILVPVASWLIGSLVWLPFWSTYVLSLSTHSNAISLKPIPAVLAFVNLQTATIDDFWMRVLNEPPERQAARVSFPKNSIKRSKIQSGREQCHCVYVQFRKHNSIPFNLNAIKQTKTYHATLI